MPAVDYRVPDGLSVQELDAILRAALDSGRAMGIEVTIFNPRIDQDGGIARSLVRTLVQALPNPVRR
jgi:arginase